MDSENTDSVPSPTPPASASSTPPPAPVPVPPTPPSTTAARTPRTTPSGNDKIWSILSHISCFFGIWIILPLVVYLAMKDDSEYVANNAREALNFHISLFIYTLCCLPLVFIVIGVPLLVIMGLAALVLAVVAAVKAADGGCYRYPLTIRLIS